MNENFELIEEKYILEYIRDILNSYKLKLSIVNTDNYHHNSRYDLGASIIKNGIMSLNDQNKNGIIKLSKEKLDLMGDISSHVNGNNGISLSKVGLTDLYRDEDEYDPFASYLLDFIISKDVNASRMTEHYGNEFVCYEKILPKMFKSLDVRLIDYLLQSEKKYDLKRVNEMIKKYNSLRDICNSMVESDIDFPLREMSLKDKFDIDASEIKKLPKLVLK